mgnify:CR=1 FL=1
MVTDAAAAPTCTNEGITEGAHCRLCGKILTAQETVPAAGHAFGDWQQITSPNCIDQGRRKRVCQVCGYEETADVAAYGHDWETDYTVDQEAACTTDGSRSIHCKNCDATKDSEVIPATGHTIVTDEAAAATCTTEGKTAGSHCSVCNMVFTAQEEVPKTDHNYSGWKITRKPTALKAGKQTRTCQVCGEEETESLDRLKASVKLSATKKTLKVKKSYTLKVSGLAYGDSVKSFKSSKKKVAAVNKKGKITAKKKGSATITVTLKSGKTAKCKITVK